MDAFIQSIVDAWNGSNLPKYMLAVICFGIILLALTFAPLIALFLVIGVIIAVIYHFQTK